MRPAVNVDATAILVVVGVAVAGFLGWKAYKAAAGVAGSVADTVGAAAQSVATAVNPADENNLVNRLVSSAGEAVTKEPGWSLGGQLAEWFSPGVAAANAMNNSAPTVRAQPVNTAVMDRWDSYAQNKPPALAPSPLFTPPASSWFTTF